MMLAAVQKGIKAKLDAASLGVTVYDGAPASATFPHIEFGADTSFPDDADCVLQREITLQIDIWTRNQSKMKACRDLVDAVYGALHEVDLTLDSPFAPVTCRVTLTRTVMDPDGITAHGIVQVALIVQDVS